MKFKVGDKVKVKSLRWYNSNKNHYGFVNDDNCSEPFSDKMAEYCGKVLEITAIEFAYYILADDDQWCFADFMLEDKVVVKSKTK